MNHRRLVSWCVSVLSFVPSLASADKPSLAEWTQQRVQAGIVTPLTQREGSRFSRALPAPRQRRIRVPEAAARDPQGREFQPFAVDIRFGGEWRENDIVGCAYRASGALFVKRGDSYFPAALLLGKKVAAIAGVCQPAPPQS